MDYGVLLAVICSVNYKSNTNEKHYKLFFYSLSAHQQTHKAPSRLAGWNDTIMLFKKYWSVEVDLAPFILGGYSFSLKYSFRSLQTSNVYGICFLPFRSFDNMMSDKNYENGFRN
ncbi:MAG: hypothetical protein IPI10_14490 [Bacteroidetes bacterium]|nr:hypothetical protein [Bacteroidota bacterium]